jgi:hypothetical protein
MNTRLLFRVRILDKMYFGIGTQPLNLRDCDKVIDAFAVELEMEARVLKSVRKLDYCLSDLVNLLLGRDLEHNGERLHIARHEVMVTAAHHNLELLRLVGKDNGDREDGI